MSRIDTKFGLESDSFGSLKELKMKNICELAAELEPIATEYFEHGSFQYISRIDAELVQMVLRCRRGFEMKRIRQTAAQEPVATEYFLHYSSQNITTITIIRLFVF